MEKEPSYLQQRAEFIKKITPEVQQLIRKTIAELMPPGNDPLAPELTEELITKVQDSIKDILVTRYQFGVEDCEKFLGSVIAAYLIRPE